MTSVEEDEEEEEERNFKSGERAHIKMQHVTKRFNNLVLIMKHPTALDRQTHLIKSITQTLLNYEWSLQLTVIQMS